MVRYVVSIPIVFSSFTFWYVYYLLDIIYLYILFMSITFLFILKCEIVVQKCSL